MSHTTVPGLLSLVWCRIWYNAWSVVLCAIETWSLTKMHIVLQTACILPYHAQNKESLACTCPISWGVIFLYIAIKSHLCTYHVLGVCWSIVCDSSRKIVTLTKRLCEVSDMLLQPPPTRSVAVQHQASSPPTLSYLCKLAPAALVALLLLT